MDYGAGEIAGHLAIQDCCATVDEHVHDAGRQFDRIVEVGDGLKGVKIDQGYVSPAAFGEVTPVTEAEGVRHQTAAPVHELRHRQQRRRHHEIPIGLWVGRVLSRMTGGTVRTRHHPGLDCKRIDVIKIHVEGRDARVACAHHLDRGINWFHAHLSGDLVQCHSIPFAFSCDEQGVGSASTPDIGLHFLAETIPQVRVGQAFEHCLFRIRHRPAGDDRTLETGAGSTPRVLISRNGKTPLPRRAHETDNIATLTPYIPAERLQMRNVHRDVCFFTDRDSFLHSTE